MLQRRHWKQHKKLCNASTQPKAEREKRTDKRAGVATKERVSEFLDSLAPDAGGDGNGNRAGGNGAGAGLTRVCNERYVVIHAPANSPMRQPQPRTTRPRPHQRATNGAEAKASIMQGNHQILNEKSRLNTFTA